MNNHVITTEAVILRGEFYRKMWLVGWMFSSICLGAVGYVCGLDHGRQQSIEEIRELSATVKQAAELQNKTTGAFISAYEDQRQNFDLVTSWAEYVRDREQLSDFNKGRITKRGSKIDPSP